VVNSYATESGISKLVTFVCGNDDPEANDSAVAKSGETFWSSLNINESSQPIPIPIRTRKSGNITIIRTVNRFTFFFSVFILIEF
jgi:hypothetical protein